MEPAPKTFLFVNKTQSSRVLSRAEGAERIHVQSHSQQARRSRESTAAVAAHQPWTVTTHVVNSQSGAASRKAKARSIQARSSDEHCFPMMASSQATGSHRRQVARMLGNQALTQCPSRNGSDPFNCTIAGSDISHYHHVVMGFVAGQSTKTTFFAEAFAPGGMQRRSLPMRHDAALANRLRGCIQDKALMYSTLAYGANLLGWMGGVSDAFKPAEHFTAQAIQAVRRRIVSPPTSSTNPRSESDSQLALSIYSLAISELWKVMPLMRNRSAGTNASPWSMQPKQLAPTSRMHLQALLELVNNSGGWGAFDPYVLESAILVDKYLACWEWTTPLIAISSLPAEYNLPIADFDPTTVALGRKLLAMNLNPQVTNSIQEIVRYVYLAKQAWALAPLPFDVQSSLFFQLQRLMYELLCYTGLEPVDNCVRVAALVFLQANMLYRGAHICAATLASQLRPALMLARFWEDTFDPGLRFWCLTSALLLTEPSPDDDWFRTMLPGYLDEISQSSSSLDDARTCLEEYLYLDERQGGQLADVVGRISRTTANT
ncbi:hypothetical protein V2A60_005231 [Cordyceps javanica]